MKDRRAPTLLPALLCAAAMLTFACNRGAETASQTAQAETPAVQPNELRPEPQAVEIREDTPSPAGDEADVAARERRLRESATPTPSRRTEEHRAEVTPTPAPEPVFEEPAPEEAAAVPEAAEEPAEEPLVTTVTLPAGTQLDVEFTRALASNTAAPGDTFRVRVAHDVMEDGEVAIPGGSEILGEVTEAVPLRKVGGQAKLALRFTDLVLPSGATVPIDASFVQQGRSETGKDAATIGGAAAGGAILGRILSKGNRSKGSVIGAIIGAAAGTAIASRTPGEEVVIPEGSVVSLKLDGSVEVRVQPSRR